MNVSCLAGQNAMILSLYTLFGHVMHCFDKQRAAEGAQGASNASNNTDQDKIFTPAALQACTYMFANLLCSCL